MKHGVNNLGTGHLLQGLWSHTTVGGGGAIKVLPLRKGGGGGFCHAFNGGGGEWGAYNFWVVFPFCSLSLITNYKNIYIIKI